MEERFGYVIKGDGKVVASVANKRKHLGLLKWVIDENGKGVEGSL